MQNQWNKNSYLQKKMQIPKMKYREKSRKPTTRTFPLIQGKDLM